MDHPDSPNANKPRRSTLFGFEPGECFLMGLEGVYQTTSFSLTSHHLFAAPGELKPTLLAGSAVLSIFIVTVEARSIILPHYWQAGKKFLELGGMVFKTEKGERLRIFRAKLIRMAIAGVFSLMIGTTMGEDYFADDINTYFDMQERRQNEGLVEAVAARVDAHISEERKALAEAEKRAHVLAEQVSRLRGKVAAGRARADLAGQLPALAAQLADEDATVARLQGEVGKLVAGRTDTMTRDAKGSPAYARRPHGLLSETKALLSMAAADSEVRAVLVTFIAFFACIELGLVIAISADSSPSASAGERAYQLYRRAVQLARMARAEPAVDDLDVPPPPPQDDVVPPANDNGAPAFDEPSFGELVGGSGLRNGLDEPPPVPPRRPRGRPRKDALN